MILDENTLMVLELLYREGVNDGLREALGRPLRGEQSCVDQAVGLIAKAMEARRAETQSGSVHDSAVPERDLPK